MYKNTHHTHTYTYVKVSFLCVYENMQKRNEVET